MSMRSHEHFEELISASLAGDLSDAERQQLDAHLDWCAACRATLASFADQRRIMAGLRHVAPPRDLGARVRTGIEGGAWVEVPWWRRPMVVFGGLGGGLAAVAGALLALVVLNSGGDGQQVGTGSDAPGPSMTLAASAVVSTAAPAPSATPPASSPPPSAAPTPEPIEPSPEPDVYLAYTGPFDNLLLTLRDGRTGETLGELAPPGQAVAAALSPNGQFLAYITQVGESGLNEVWVTHVAANTGMPATPPEGSLIETSLAELETVSLGQSVAGSEFLEQLAWSPNNRWLAFTLAAPDGGGTDTWIFGTANGETQRLTSTGDSYAASWLAGQSGPSLLWLSYAGAEPRSDLVEVDDRGGAAECCTVVASVAVFQPLMSPDGARAIYWRGVMDRVGDEWTFVEGGSPYIAEARMFDNTLEFVDERQLFSDVTIDRDAFTAAGIVWGADSDAYAVWRAQWTGTPQGAGGEHPNINRVYFGHASDERELTEMHAIDAADLPEGAFVVDVKVPTGRHLAITAAIPIGGIMEAPMAQLILVTRNTGQVADEVRLVEGPGDDGWFGPAAYDAYWVVSAD